MKLQVFLQFSVIKWFFAKERRKSLIFKTFLIKRNFGNKIFKTKLISLKYNKHIQRNSRFSRFLHLEKSYGRHMVYSMLMQSSG